MTTLPAGWKPRLSCPFCGSNFLFTVPDEVGSGGQWVSPIHVGCNDCKAEQVGDTEDEAVSRWNARATPPATTQDDTLARTGNTADHQNGWFAGVDHGRDEARASAQDDAISTPYLQALADKVVIMNATGDPDLYRAAVKDLLAAVRTFRPAPAAGDARDAERYRTWRDAMVAEDTEFRLTVAAALPSEVGDTRPPTSAEWDAGIDAAIAAQQGKGDQ